MDSITSAELDSPSKTPLFLGIAAILLAIAGLVIAWMGFSKVQELEAQLASASESAAVIEQAEKGIAANAERLDKVVEGITTMRGEVNTVLVSVQKDMKTVKKDIRSNTMKAGMAMKKVEELAAKGVAAAPKPAPIRTSKADGPEPVEAETAPKTSGELQEYRIKSGDNFSRLASKFKVTVTEMLEANPDVDPGRLQIGQKIVIPTAN